MTSPLTEKQVEENLVAIIEQFQAQSLDGHVVTIFVHAHAGNAEWDAEAYTRPEGRRLITEDGKHVKDFGCGCYQVEGDKGEPLFLIRCS